MIKNKLYTLKQDHKPENTFNPLLAAPARRALESKGIKSLEQLSQFSEAEILSLHGMGQNAMSKLRSALQAKGLSFKK